MSHPIWGAVVVALVADNGKRLWRVVVIIARGPSSEERGVEKAKKRKRNPLWRSEKRNLAVQTRWLGNPKLCTRPRWRNEGQDTNLVISKREGYKSSCKQASAY